MKESKLITYIKILINFVIAILVALFLIFILPRMLRFFLPFVIGWIVAMIANPLVHFLEKRVKLLRKHSSAIIIILAIVIIVGSAVLLVVALVKEARGLVNDIPVILKEAQHKFQEALLYIDRLTAPLPDSLHKALDNTISGIQNSITEYMNESKPLTVDSAGNFVGNVAEGFLMVIITILSAYFFAAGKNELTVGLKKI